MKMPEKAPDYNKLRREIKVKFEEYDAFLEYQKEKPIDEYLHWDELRRKIPPHGLSIEQWWYFIKNQRENQYKYALPFFDKKMDPFKYCLPDFIQERLHKIDTGIGNSILSSLPEPMTNSQVRDKYLINSLIEEAITSSQLEGAVTTREIAKEMIRTSRKPRDISEQMILNNYHTMQRVREFKDQPLTPEMVFEIHRLVSENTHKKNDGTGRFRRADEPIEIGDDYGEVFHTPPAADQLEWRVRNMCEFANADTPFVHPVARSIMLHFWLAYDHPFVDGNGRTARALFYWSMLRRGYWFFEFISISSILRKAPTQYARSFLETETDDNDLTYFIIAQTKVIQRAIEELHAYIQRKTARTREIENQLRGISLLNHRQRDLILHALKHPYQIYTIESHQGSHVVAYQTARTDLLDLHKRELLELRKDGKKMIFYVPQNLEEKLREIK